MKSFIKLMLATVSLFSITAANAADINVRIVNLTNGIYFTPFLVAVHPAGSSLFTTGQPASANLQMMAEGGNIAGLVTDMQALGATISDNPAGGLLGPAASTNVDLNTDGTSNVMLSVVAMQGYLETLVIRSETLTDEERNRCINIARKHATRLGVLIGDLFELSKLDAASVTPKLEAFSLPELVQDVAQEFELEADEKGISVVIDVNSDVAFTMGDIGLIQRVLENLMRNAIRFTPNGGTVTLSITDRSQSVAVAVSDTGTGIPDKEIPRIFDRFYRAVSGEEARSESSGLGLAIVKRILDLHDSRITVESRLNRGTRFEFELPIYRAAA